MQPSSSSKLDVTTGALKRKKSGSGANRGIAGEPPVHDLPPHLVVQRILGEGGTSVVYQALHTRLKVPVAVKVLARLEHHQQEAAERLLREAELCARLTDPRFPRIYDVDQLEDGTPYMVMEHISGRTLADLIGAGPFDVEAAWAVAREVLEALMDIHDLGVIHRDIKPGNILIETPEGREQRVRIVDFGIAKSTNIGQPVEPLTEQGAMVGTPHYMAPEQMRGARLDARVDLYAVGAVLYEMLAGRPPFDGPTIGEVIAATLRDDPAPLHSLRDDVPEALEEFVKKAMARDRRDRFATAHEMLCALHAARMPVSIPPPMRPTQRIETVAFPREESGTRPVANRPTNPKASLLIVPDPIELADGTPRPSRPLDTGRLRAPRRTYAWKAAIALVAVTVPFWPTRLDDRDLAFSPPLSASAPVSPVPVTAAPAALPSVQPVVAPQEATQPPSSAPLTGVPQPILIQPRGASEADGGQDRRSSRRRSRTERAVEAPTVAAPAVPPANDTPQVTPQLRVRTPDSLPESRSALPSNPY